MGIDLPEQVWSRREVLQKPSPVPDRSGIYGWYFREIPPAVPITGCVRYHDLVLLYIGIAPQEPARSGTWQSSRTLLDRISSHYKGNAAGSTLRLSLGCLPSRKLGIELRMVGSGKKMTFAEGEDALSDWMNENAFVTWIQRARPWEEEEGLIAALGPPLNLKGNEAHPFHKVLADLRRYARQNARRLPRLQAGLY